ncbi:MAG: oxidoreductase-like domain-containing protein [Rhodanobacter sp.]
MSAGDAPAPATPDPESEDAETRGGNESNLTDASAPLDPKPIRPQEPDAADCCGEGCIRCVYDQYEGAFERYQAALAAWRERQS